VEEEEETTMQCCPICGHPFTAMDAVLGESDVRFQCHHCWSRVQATGPVTRSSGEKAVRVVPKARRATARKK
jgi:hypothetical protein